MVAITDQGHRQELVAKRRLGQTELQVDAGQVGTSNATKPKNLGLIDYAHIRIPLPRDLKGSGIFHASRGHSTPGAYFLMRRSSDGYVSASGMFKVAFPWASESEEAAEKAHLKKLAATSKEEVAGNIWVPPQQALDLADEYSIRDWILVLLDPAPITSEFKKTIQSPPVFHPSPASPTSPARSTRSRTPVLSNGTSIPPPTSPKDKSPRKRALRSTSPVKMPPPEKEAKTPRKIATPKRTKRGRATAASASVEPEDSETAAPATKSRKVSRTTKKDAEASKEDSVKVSIQTTTEPSASGETEVEVTKVEIETPADHPSLDSPADAQAYLDSAKEAIKAARDQEKDTQPEKSSGRGRKRKAADITRDEDEEEDQASAPAEVDVEDSSEKPTSSGQADNDDAPAPKRRRVQEIELRKDRVKRRAAFGIAAGLAVGAVVPYLGTYFGF